MNKKGDACHVFSDQAAMEFNTLREMSMTIRARIALLIGLAIATAFLIGGAGIFALRQADSKLTSLYETAVLPLVDVTTIRSLFNDNRTALNRALLIGTVEAAKHEQEGEQGLVRQMDEAWERYYPAKISSNQERVAADRFIQIRARTRQLKQQLEPLMNAGKREEATSFMLGTVGPAFTEESKAIDAIVSENVHQAALVYAQARELERRTILIVMACLAFAVACLVVGGVVLRRSIMAPLIRARHLAGQISEGSLGHHIEVNGRDEVSDTLRALGRMDDTLAEIVRKVRDNANQVAHAARDIAAGNDELSTRTQEQASSLEETAASMEEMTASVRENAGGAKTARTLSETLLTDAAQGRRVADEAMTAMARITQASQEIGGIAVLIDEIAFQTNLLALNAAVEAARAGDQGRGFAVVATEVRRLAHRSATAAKEIKQLIQSTSERIDGGAVLVTQAGEALVKMEAGTARVSGIVAQIASASMEQSAGIEQVNHAVVSLDTVTQQNAALVEEASAASRQALERASELTAQVSFFRFFGESDQVNSSPQKVDEPLPPVLFSLTQRVKETAEDSDWKEF